jgi:hypothetical protein
MRSFVRKYAQLLKDDHSGSLACQDSFRPLQSIHDISCGFICSGHCHQDFGLPFLAFRHYEAHVVNKLLGTLHDAWGDVTKFLSTRRVTVCAVLSTHVNASSEAGLGGDADATTIAGALRSNTELAQVQLTEVYLGMSHHVCSQSINYALF